jgi:hypothetical protein
MIMSPRQNVIYDGDIIIVLEGLENFRDPDTNLESSLKFWLPKTFPDRVKVIVTASPNSKSSKYMRSQGCNVVSITADKKIMRNWLTNLERQDHVGLLADKAHVNRLTEMIDYKLSNENVKMIFVKAMMGLLAPAIYIGVEDEQREKEMFRQFFSRLDWGKLKGRPALRRNK